MKNILNNKFILITMTLVIGLGLGWLIKPSSYQMIESSTSSHDHASENEIYTCSMHPQIRQNEPGSCPICGMDLIPLDSDTDMSDPMTIRMSPTAMKLATVETMMVSTSGAIKTIRLNGKVMENERRVFTQSSHIPGRVESLNVDFTGEYVTKGQVIATIYSPELVTAQQELFEAQKIISSQPALFEAAKGKLANWKLSSAQIDAILANGKPLENLAIRAEKSGYVKEKMVNLGDYIKQGAPLYMVADLSEIWVMFEGYESDMQWIRRESVIDFTVSSLPGQTFSGKIAYIDPVISPKTRVSKLRLEIKNPDMVLKPEMFVSGVLKSPGTTKNPTIVVPKSAVMWTGKRSVVYVKTNDTNGPAFQMRMVTLGSQLGESYVIKEGLKAGEEIVVNGTFSIDAAAQLAGKPSMMSPEGGAAMTGHNHGGMTAPTTAVAQNPKPSMQLSASAKSALQPLFTKYLEYKEALVNDDMSVAKTQGAELNRFIGSVDMSLFKGDPHNKWMDYHSKLKQSLEHLAHFENLTELRAAFKQTSDVMIAIGHDFMPNDQPLYVQFCPMADGNKGANWLSDSKEIENPYFGATMLTCGEVTETIK